MKRLSTIALTVGILTASCSGHGGQSSLPPTAGTMNGAKSAHATASIAAPAGWAATATQGVTIAKGSNTGTLAPTTPMTIRVGLNLHNADQLQSLIASGQKISPAQFAAQFAPTQSEVQSVVSYLQSEGFTNIEADQQLVSATGTAAKVSHAFNTTLNAFTLNGANLYANTTPAFVPSSLGNIVSAVLGLSNAAKMSIPGDYACVRNTNPPTGQCLARFEPADVQHYYAADTLAPATNTSVAVIAEGDMTSVVSDLRYAESHFGLPQVPVSVVTVGLKSPDTSGGGEWDLDTQSSTGMAQNVKMLYIYATTSLTDSDIANAYSQWVKQDVAQTGNSSFGECEYQAYLDGAMKVDDNLFMQAAAQGQTMFASSGDTGSSCALAPTNGVPGSGPPMVSYPAASPYANAVGGTSVVRNTNDANYVGEAAWNSGGGGLSQFENATSWEEPVQVTTGILAAGNLRGVPDIAMAGDANAGAYRVYGGPNVPLLGDCTSGCSVGGTSESSPLAMGAYARILSAHNNTLGFGPPLFYKNYVRYESGETLVQGPPPTESYGGFHDIISGTNGAYQATPGYDYTTGVGTFNVGALSSTIAQ